MRDFDLVYFSCFKAVSLEVRYTLVIMSAPESQPVASSSVNVNPNNAGSPMDTAPPATAVPTITESYKKDRELAEFMLMLDEYEPLVDLNLNIGTPRV